jgi:integrase/recombinase XerD
MPIRKKRDTSAAQRARRNLFPELPGSGFTPYVRQFIEWSAVSNCSGDTIKRRDAALRRFVCWCDERDLHEPQQITKPILERYKRYLFYYRKPDGDPLSIGSQNVMLTPIRSFFKWLTRTNHILYNPASELEIPKKPKRLPKAILQLEDIENILNQTNIDTPQGIRDRAIIEVLYSTGMRRMEIVKLSIYDIDVRRSIVYVREGKGNKDRVIPIGERALAWLEKYKLEVRPELIVEPDNGILFITDYGEAFERDQLTHSVKKYLIRAGIDVVGSCHLFRHACATHMLDNGADIRFIQAMLGHDDLNTTEIYTRVSIEKLKAVHGATHPTTKNSTQHHPIDNEDHDRLLMLLDDEDLDAVK